VSINVIRSITLKRVQEVNNFLGNYVSANSSNTQDCNYSTTTEFSW